MIYQKTKTVDVININRLLVHQTGIEPAAFTFGVCYSIP